MENGDFEVTITSGAKELETAIAGEFVMPKKLILTKEQKEENKDGLRDLLTGAFCLQGIQDVSFNVKNEEGHAIQDYSKSLYDSFPDAGGCSH